jgi:hypothetical protein
MCPTWASPDLVDLSARADGDVVVRSGERASNPRGIRVSEGLLFVADGDGRPSSSHIADSLIA